MGHHFGSESRVSIDNPSFFAVSSSVQRLIDLQIPVLPAFGHAAGMHATCTQFNALCFLQETDLKEDNGRARQPAAHAHFRSTTGRRAKHHLPMMMYPSIHWQPIHADFVVNVSASHMLDLAMICTATALVTLQLLVLLPRGSNRHDSA